jgi:tRNA nucleotidyltransferase (CCA-adding enzyme)
MDLVVEGDAAALAGALADRLGARLTLHERFGTAKLGLTGGEELDLASARTERYRRPGALPEVRLGASMAEDLARRDFTLNAIALSLGPRSRLVDPFGGRSDLELGIVRVLHEGSFRDDPTRLFRAVRYASRLSFRLDPRTRFLFGDAVRSGCLESISPDRRRREVRRILDEPGRGASLRRLRRLGLAAALHPALGRDAAAPRRAERAEHLACAARESPTWLCYLLTWMGEVVSGETEALADRLGLAGLERARVLAWPRTRAAALRGQALGPSPLSVDELIAAAADLPLRQARRLLAAARRDPVRLTIRGADLVAAGVAPGPAVGRALASTRQARERGGLRARDELEFALQAARRERA